MRGIAALLDPKLTVAMGQKHGGKDDAKLGFNRSHPALRAPNGQHLEGVPRLVNPSTNDAEVAAGEDDPVERDYLGRLLHVADEALQHVKRGGDHRKRRGRPH
jgi:hypothetical protein